MNKGTRLGNNPLDWIGKDIKNPTDKKEPKKEANPTEKRETFIIKTSLSEKIKDFSYWERMKQKDVLNSILEEYFEKNPVKKRPK